VIYSAEKKYPITSKSIFFLLCFQLLITNEIAGQCQSAEKLIHSRKVQLLLSESFMYSKSILNTNGNAVGVSSGWANSLDVMLFSVELRKMLSNRNGLGIEIASGAYSINAKRNWKVYDTLSGIFYGGSSFTTAFPTKDISINFIHNVFDKKRLRLDCYVGSTMIFPTKSNSYPYESVINGNNIYSYIYVGSNEKKSVGFALKCGLSLQYKIKRFSVFSSMDFQQGFTTIKNYTLISQFNQYRTSGLIESRAEAFRAKIGLGYYLF